MRTRLSRLTKVEKIAVAFLSIAVAVTGFQVGHAFYLQNTDITPIEGGVYTEGAVGKIPSLNPLYVPYGSIGHGLSKLIFSGLTQYDPKTGKIVPDLADYSISDNGRGYTFTLREGVKWHDGTPVTSDDVLFTYNTVIANPEFKGLILNYNDYSGTKLTKVDERTVKFLLEKPDSFFLVKTLPGILPEHILGNVPIRALEDAPFNLAPIGSGPYRLVSVSPIDNYTEVNLEAFPDYYGKKMNIPLIRVKIFPDQKALVKHQGELDGIRNVSEDFTEKILEKGRLHLVRYHLPQYTAIFINTQSPTLRSGKLRLALQLGTDKKAIAEALGQSKIIDTPLLEIDQKNWVYQYSVSKANGALFDAEWKLPDQKSDESDTQAETPTKEPEPTFINGPNGGNNWQTIDKKVTLTGTVPPKTKAVFINDYELKKFVPGDLLWSYTASFEFENLQKGENIFRLYATDFDDVKKELDSITITQGEEDEFINKELNKVSEENQMAQALPVRVNQKGEQLTLRLLAPQSPASYQKAAELLRGQWEKIGVGLSIQALEDKAFQEALFKRNYDLLIFGQNLGYNLDAYPYWHSSQAKEGGFNLSQFKNFIVDSLLEKARFDSNEDSRKKTLNEIQKIISEEVPAIFLYSPTYYFALSDKIQNTHFDHLATTSDRFGAIGDWYANVSRRFKKGVTPLTFLTWIVKQF